MTVLSDSTNFNAYNHGSNSGDCDAVVTTTDAYQWLVFNSPGRILVNSYEVINPTGSGGSIDVTVVRSNYSLEDLGGDIDPSDDRVTEVLPLTATAAGAAPVAAVDNESHPRLVAIGVKSSAEGVAAAGVLLNWGVSV